MPTRRYKKTIRDSPNKYDIGGQMLKAAPGVMGVFGNAFDQAKIADTSGIESNISQQKNAIVGAMNNDALMSEWSNMTNLDAITAKDLRTGNAGMGLFNGALSGASSGASFGPWGAAIGAGVGLLSSGIGSLVGANKSRKKANALNADIITANTMRNNAFVNKANAIDKMNDMNMMANFAAKGGKLNKPIIQRYRNDNFVANLFKPKAKESIPFEGFGGGHFGGATVGSSFDDSTWKDIQWTDLRTPIEGDSFNDAFRRAREGGKDNFSFNGKDYNTTLGPDSTYNPNAGNTRENLRLRMVFDEANRIQRDSTRIEPELGQPIVKMLDKGKRNISFAYGGSLFANGGELTREEYLKQNYQNYLKGEAEKGRKAVVEGREKFAKDYVIPAIKTAGSFTPAGPLIGLMDAKQAWDDGNTGWAIAGAGMEALPYVGKGIGKGVKALKNIKKSKFISSIDWGKFNKEIPENKKLLDEYNLIEETSKKNNTWMKNPDGSSFSGTPEQFIQQQSNNFKEAFPKGSKIVYRGDPTNPEIIKSQEQLGKDFIKFKYGLTENDNVALETLWNRYSKRLNTGIYTTDIYEKALDGYAKGNKNNVTPLYIKMDNPKIVNTGESFKILQKERDLLLNSGYDSVITPPSFIYPSGENVVFNSTNLKSAIGNNGMFDMTNPNIYKTIIGGAIGAKVLTSNKNLENRYQGGGTIPKRNVSFADGGNLFANGGDFSNGVTLINAGGTHEENPNMGVPMGVDQEGTPNLVEEGEVKFNDYIFSNRIYANDTILEKAGLGKRFKGNTFAAIAEKISRESMERPNDPISKRGLNQSMAKLTQAQEEQKQIEDMKKSKNSNPNVFANGGNPFIGGSLGYTPEYQLPFALNIPGKPASNGLTRVDSKSLEVAKINNLKDINISKVANTQSNNFKFDPSWLRYAPVLGSAISVAGDLFGNNNKPDYTNSNMIAKANRPISFAPIGDYMDYNPLDRDYYQNKLNQSASATRDAVINNSGGNRGAATAGILAADFNAQSKVGDLARMAEEYNATQKLKSTEFNRGTNMYNSEMGFKADATNRESDLMTARMVALMREDERNRSNMTRSANLTNFFDNLGNVGWEQANRNMITSNPALYYTIKGNGEIEYKLPPGTTPADEAAIRAHAEKEKKSRKYAKGGKLKTRKTYTYGW